MSKSVSTAAPLLHEGFSVIRPVSGACIDFLSAILSQEFDGHRDVEVLSSHKTRRPAVMILGREETRRDVPLPLTDMYAGLHSRMPVLRQPYAAQLRRLNLVTMSSTGDHYLEADFGRQDRRRLIDERRQVLRAEQQIEQQRGYVLPTPEEPTRPVKMTWIYMGAMALAGDVERARQIADIFNGENKTWPVQIGAAELYPDVSAAAA